MSSRLRRHRWRHRWRPATRRKVRPVSISDPDQSVVIATAALAVLVTMCAMIAVAAMLAWSTMQQRADTIAELVAASADVALALRDAERGREALRHVVQLRHGDPGATVATRRYRVLVTYTQSGRRRSACVALVSMPVTTGSVPPC